MAEITKRAQIAVPMQAGHSVRSVPKQLGVAIKTVNNIMKCLRHYCDYYSEALSQTISIDQPIHATDFLLTHF